MLRLLWVPVLVGVGCVVAGLYGAVHNQISYTVSPEYFHAFKFAQFQISEPWQGRVGASLVGWYASWWMGLILSIPVLVLGMGIEDPREYARHSIRAYGVVAVTALVVGLVGLAWGFAVLTEASVAGWWRPEDVDDVLAFERAGVMHNASYLGGVLGVLTGGTSQIAAARRLSRRPRAA